MSQLALDTALAVRVETSALSAALRLVLPFADGGLAVFAGVQIMATTDDELILEATNGDQRVITSLSAGVTDPGRVIVPARVLDAFVRSVSGAVQLNRMGGDTLAVECGSSSLELKTLPEADWPLFAALDVPEFELTPDAWTSVKRVIFAQGGTEEKSASRHCVHFDNGAVVAQSVSRLAFSEIPGLKASSNVPGKFLGSLVKLVDPKASVFVRFGERLACFRSGPTEWMTRPVADSYPDWRALVGQHQKRLSDSGSTLVVARSDLLTALARTALLPEGSGWKRMTMTRVDNELSLVATGPDVGTITDVIPCDGTYQGAPIIMDVPEFRTAIDNTVEDELTFGVVDAWKSLQIQEPPWTGLIMPRRPPGADPPPEQQPVPSASAL